MPDPVNPQPLDYRSPPDRRRRYIESPEEKQWRYRRVLFRIGLVAIVGLIDIHYARNYFLYGKLADLRPADFVSFVQHVGVPQVCAIKEFDRDLGQPGALRAGGDLKQLEPKYLPSDTYDPYYPDELVWGDQHELLILHLGHTVTYDFTPGAEKWEVHGAVANGVIPLPPVTIPATQPAPHP